jgi:hypothetical protein
VTVVSAARTATTGKSQPDVCMNRVGFAYSHKDDTMTIS